MSTFNGRFPRLPGISADRFDGPNRQSRVFFLSHCHTDHMVGLDHLDGLPGPLYLSRVSALIVKQLFSKERVWSRCVVLEIGQPTLVSYTTEEGALRPHRLTVTAFPAGHCPGSVMFVFELGDQRVLYTGDFRLSLNDCSHMKIFQTACRFDVAHIDSTFFSTNYKHFPTQRESAKVVNRLINEWLEAHPANQVVLQLSARYGYEYLFNYINKDLKLTIHVNDTEANTWHYVPELDGCFSSSKSKSRIHACYSADVANRSCRSTRTVPCNPQIDEGLVRVIKPSAMIWNDLRPEDEIWLLDGPQFYRVCYSNHSSWSEVRDFLCIVRPKEVELNVLPLGNNRSVMLAELQSVMAEYQKDGDLEAGNEVIDDQPALLAFANIKFSVNSCLSVKRIDVAAEDSDDEPLEHSRVLLKRRKTGSL